MSVFELITVLLALTATFGWINHRFIGLPHAIGLLLIGLVASLAFSAVEAYDADIKAYEELTGLVRQVHFQQALLEGMLGFLLFAGALHVNFSTLKRRSASVGLMATLGVLISTVVVGYGLWWLARALGTPLPLSWALVFGALISPTDPVAVLGTLKQVRVPEVLETDMAGESLFNDGVGVVIFAVLLALAAGGEGKGVSVMCVAEMFFYEALGGAILGFASGYVAYRAMRAIDDFPVEILISLALVTGSYALASRLHMSGPISVVVAGLLIGHRGPQDALSDETQRYLFAFWTVVDEILNSVLFLLIGLEVLVLGFDAAFTWLIALAIPLVLAGRTLAVSIPFLILRTWHRFAPGTVPVLIWGGLRGGISVALALSMPDSASKPLILAITYSVVLFSILVQGLSLGRVVRRLVQREQARC
ncbi:MAG: sodium:proton antiporter [Rhodospirillales bacterium]|nr:sodium:proton antiporter [Rhodospirillales bacterium]